MIPRAAAERKDKVQEIRYRPKHVSLRILYPSSSQQALLEQEGQVSELIKARRREVKRGAESGTGRRSPNLSALATASPAAENTKAVGSGHL